jgi:AcrR family transcriptional regulator
MSVSGKRSYTSELRATQAMRTRRQIVDAASTLFAERGYGATTIDAIAAAAGVSRKTVFTSAGGKLELLKLAYDFAVAGDDEPVAMRDRPAIRALEALEDPVRLLTGFAEIITGIGGRIAPVFGALQAAAEVEAEARALFETVQAQRLSAMVTPAKRLSALGALKPGLTVRKAADILWVHNDPALYLKLVVQREWSRTQFRQWLAGALCDQLLAPTTGRPGRPVRPVRP